MSKTEEVIQFTKEPYIEDVGPRRIKSITFSTFSEADILKSSEVQVYKDKYYDEKKKPVEGGLLDPRMGPTNKNGFCATCNGSFRDCPGHYGCLTLTVPVYNVGYLATIVDILKCICKNCASILLPEKEHAEFLKRMRKDIDSLKKTELFKRIVKKCTAMASSKKAVKCLKCGYINGTVKRAGLGVDHDRSKVTDNSLEESRSAISHLKDSTGSKSPSIINPDRVLSLFKKMQDKDCDLLYLSDRPEKFLITSIAVPPVPIRPSVFVDGGQMSNENDISERLKLIIQTNATLHQNLTTASYAPKALELWPLLQVEVARYINSDVRGVPLSMQESKPLSGFVQRLKGKQGRFRGNLSGKRVEYTGRTVISPDPNLKITEVAIPILMAQILTYPERVSSHNIEKLRQCVRNGFYKYPGANFIRLADGTSMVLKFPSRTRLADELKFGQIVERHLEDGDIILFNRQPSLHRMSIMCHRARIMPWRTLRFNESVCNPYNADFDGDEMNMHVPQTEEARTEAVMLMGVQNNLCTPKNGEILVASTQDFLTSSFLITRKDTFYDRASFSLMCCYMGDAMDHIDLPTPALIKPVELWTGKQLFSVLLRPHATMRVYLTLTVKEKSYDSGETMCENDGFVYFRNSELVSGQLGKATLGNGNKDGMYSILLRDYKAHAASVCMNRLAKLSARWIGNHGFSIGIDDVQPGDLLNKDKEGKISDGNVQCDELINKYNNGKIELLPGCDAAQTLETLIAKVLNDIRGEAAKLCMKSLHWRNSPLIMSQCGSKGSPINISQMVACVGQQSVSGGRAPNGFLDRSLPHFLKNSKIPAAKGFVGNSFYSGLRATEFFFHTMGGREGLVDTAVKTADTGYISRRLMKSLEDLSVHYDNTVRNASGCIVQFTYGDDGMDPSQMEEKGGLPLNFNRLLMKVKAACPPEEHIGMSSSQIIKVVDETLTKDFTTLEGDCSKAFNKSLSEFLKACAERSNNTRRALKLEEEPRSGDFNILENVANNISGITRRQLQVFMETCISRYYQKVVEGGTAIGAIGAHSIGEPGTQMTLKTFHFAGVASMNVTQGVPRIKEIINAAKNISTPIITAKLEFSDNLISARMVKGRIEKTVLGQVSKSIKIVMASRSASVTVTLDMDVIQASELCINAHTVKESILRTPKIKLKEQNIHVLDARKLEVIPTSDRSKLHFELHRLKDRLPTVVVRGINSIKRAVIKECDGKKGTYELAVEGTGLDAVMGIDGVDGPKTTSNHIMEVQKTLGIEAARKSIILEIQKTMKDMSIDVRHMMLLADLMTYKGDVLGITRHGIQKMKDSVLMLASFEKTSDHLFNASVNGRVDKIEGVSECIIMGIPMQIGTGMLKVMQRVPPVELHCGSEPILS
ncbi:DNA-directed RNA polymerase III subunit 1 [Apium graveolens]|uniref:DNA-directed RNA polymerase III subunit 1 n=1 Tax=Apium graveolens TaxID=4045 RepID=UPI003D78F73D